MPTHSQASLHTAGEVGPADHASKSPNLADCNNCCTQNFAEQNERTGSFGLLGAQVCVQSVFKRPPTGIGDPDTADKLAASLLALNCYEAGTDEAR
jgi:hypothetical protein